MTERIACRTPGCTRTILASGAGGHPSWINDPTYPACPSCSRFMTFVAQVGLGDFLPAEGIYYVHHCAPCAAVTVSYDQS